MLASGTDTSVRNTFCAACCDMVALPVHPWVCRQEHHRLCKVGVLKMVVKKKKKMASLV